eukprot:382759-Ditylum_brightwellii.AAC.1
MSFALKMYNNQRSLGEWKTKDVLTKKKTKEDTKYLSLLTQMEAIANLVGKANLTKSDGGEGKGTPGEAYSSRRYQNPDSKKTMQKGNRMLKWCTNDCHKREEEGKGGAGNEHKKNNIKVALSALLSGNNFKSIEGHCCPRLLCTLAPPHCPQGQLHGRDPGALCVHWSGAQEGLDVGNLEVVVEEIVSLDYDFLVGKSPDTCQGSATHF